MKIGEVRYYTQLEFGERIITLAVISSYGEPNLELLQKSHGTYWSVEFLAGDDGIQAISVKSIEAVVMMAPDIRYKHAYQDGTEERRYFLMEKPGLKVCSMIGLLENPHDNE